MGETKLNRWLYDHCPVFVQDLMASVYGRQKNRYRYGSPAYAQWEAFYRESATWPNECLREYQAEQVRHMVAYALEHVPFYRKWFGDCGLKAADVRGPEDLALLPLLTKAEIRSAGTDLLSDAFDPAELQSHAASGSTGTPITLYDDRLATIRNYAIHWAQCRPGLTRHDRFANFTGLELVNPARRKPPFWRMNYPMHQRLYSIFHLSDTNMPHYLDDLEKFRPTWMYGYPSALSTLADFALRSGYEYPHEIKAVITSSEQCLPEYRRNIEKAFRARVWDEYGQNEMVGLAFECECGRMHVKEEYSLMEFVPTGERAEGCDVYELVCTSFVNHGWPLIRYRVGDLALVKPGASCPRGRPGRVVEAIYGRTAQCLIAADGSRITNISVIATRCRNLKALQAVQERRGQVRLRVVPFPEYDRASDEARLLAECRKRLGDESRMHIDVEYVDHIELTERGKFLMIVSKLPKEQACARDSSARPADERA